jgi:hypothetical protein
MEPHLLLLIFLPIIGFSAAVGQEPHMLRKSWGQVRAGWLLWHGSGLMWISIGTGSSCRGCWGLCCVAV